MKSGFTYRSGKGSHTWSHPEPSYSLTLSGKDGADADRYQEKDVKKALKDLEIRKQLENEPEDRGE